jgi:pyruvate/2-oxoglutarate dehydrogenase complex dihydrolipoamide dehydrogenase (E3) component
VTRSFDVVVVGGGTAGLTAALAARHEGASVALVERDGRLGGDCTYYGCVPSKALIEVAQTVSDTRRLVEDGVLAGVPSLDFPAVVERQRRIVKEIARDERDERFTNLGIELAYGPASFLGPCELAVGDAVLVGSRFVIATGSEPAVPPIRGIDDVPYLTNRTVFDLTELPERLLVLGGGPIGLELAQAFRRFGSEVTVVEMLDQLLPYGEPEAGAAVERILAADGVELRLGARALEVKGGSEIELILDEGRVSGDVLLVAAGRRASVAGLGLEALGLALDKGYARVDRRCRTSVRHVYAAGDVTGGFQLTHVAAHEGTVAGRNAAGKRARTDERVVPWVTFLDPEVAHVGLTEAAARRRHRQVRTVTFPIARVDRARIDRTSEGFVKLVTARKPLLGWLGGGQLVGAQIVGPRAGELIHECALAIHTRMFAGRLAQMIHAYPTMSVGLQQAASRLFPIGHALVEGDEGG